MANLYDYIFTQENTKLTDVETAIFNVFVTEKLSEFSVDNICTLAISVVNRILKDEENGCYNRAYKILSVVENTYTGFNGITAFCKAVSDSNDSVMVNNNSTIIDHVIECQIFNHVPKNVLVGEEITITKDGEESVVYYDLISVPRNGKEMYLVVEVTEN
jgi:hypothetical protein